MAIALILVVALATVASGDITGTNPSNGACLCFSGTSVNVRSSACGQQVIGSANSGQCFKYTGSNTRCSLNGGSYQFFRIDYRGNQGWAAGNFLNLGSDASCNSGNSGNEYKCQLTDQGRRVHELSYRTAYDCVDTSCRNTCKGGQCVAYVKCRCTRNGKYPPGTGNWRPGQKLKTADGKCNRNIASNTAIATFTSSDRYYGHAAVFIKCVNDYTVQVYDQWCSRSVGYSTYGSTHRFFNGFATITGPTDGPGSISCRSEVSGPTSCPASVPGCKK